MSYIEELVRHKVQLSRENEQLRDGLRRVETEFGRYAARTEALTVLLLAVRDELANARLQAEARCESALGRIVRHIETETRHG